MKKMKDIRGIHAAAVQNAIFKEFEIQVTSSNTGRQKNASDVLEWKNSKKIKECYERLYTDEDNSIKNIAKLAFSSITDSDKLFENIYVYTVAICDVVLNPDYPDMECSR